MGVGKDFLNRVPEVQELKSTTDQWDLIKLKSFCMIKETVS